MIEIKQQAVDTDDICEKVLTEVFGDDRIFSLDEYDTLCTVIEKTLACVSENSGGAGLTANSGINPIYGSDYIRTSGFLTSQSAVRRMTNIG